MTTEMGTEYDLWDLRTPAPTLGQLVAVPTPHTPDDTQSWESAVVNEILGPRYSLHAVSDLRKIYRDCRIQDADGSFRAYTDDELSAADHAASLRRRIAVSFIAPCSDGAPRTGIFSSYRLLE